MTIIYSDAYLAALVSAEREARAADEVAALGSLPPPWPERLTVLRCYILTCLESQKAPDDLFAAKLAAYRKEFDACLAQARAAAAAAANGAASVFSVELHRT